MTVSSGGCHRVGTSTKSAAAMFLRAHKVFSFNFYRSRSSLAFKFVEPVSRYFSVYFSLKKMTDIKLNFIALKTYLHF